MHEKSKKKTVRLCDIFNNTLMQTIKFGAGAASRYGSGSAKMMLLRLRLSNTARNYRYPVT
jgi:hypothetical protein